MINRLLILYDVLLSAISDTVTDPETRCSILIYTISQCTKGQQLMGHVPKDAQWLPARLPSIPILVYWATQGHTETRIRLCMLPCVLENVDVNCYTSKDACFLDLIVLQSEYSPRPFYYIIYSYWDWNDWMKFLKNILKYQVLEGLLSLNAKARSLNNCF